MVVGSSILKINPNRLLLLLERERNRDVVVITSEQLSVCVCWRRFKYFFLFFLVSSFILSPTGKTLAGRLPTGYITLLKTS